MTTERNKELAELLPVHVMRLANTNMGLSLMDWNEISNDILEAARLLGALAPAACPSHHPTQVRTMTSTDELGNQTPAQDCEIEYWLQQAENYAEVQIPADDLRAIIARTYAAVNALTELVALRKENERLREQVRELSDCQRLPKVYTYTGTAEVDVENMFDVGHRHRNGKQPRDYLMSWLSMFRPFAYATKDDSWGELEKLISIVMNNYVQILVRAEKARAALNQQGGQ